MPPAILTGTSVKRESTKLRVAVLFERLGPYHHARLKSAGRRLRATAVEFSNVDLTYAWDPVEGAEGFDRLTLFSGSAAGDLSAKQIIHRVNEALDQLRPQAVAIPGWNDCWSLAALSWCQKHATPAVMMSETTAWDDDRKWWKEAIKRRVVRLCSAGLVGGEAHAEYLGQLGMDRRKIFLGYDVVDNDHFAGGAAKARSEAPAARKRYELPEKYFLASARFIEKKNLIRLVEAYARYRQSAEKSRNENQKSDIWDLVLVGDGALKSTILALRASLRLDNFVHLPGFRQYDELPAHYGLAGVFIHSSTTEQWGLVVNEAMAAGLPVLVSDRCGCAADLVQAGRNGFTFDPHQPELLSDLMARVSADHFPLAEFGSASREIIAKFGAAAFGEGLAGAVESALRKPAPKAGLTEGLLLRMLMAR